MGRDHDVGKEKDMGCWRTDQTMCWVIFFSDMSYSYRHGYGY